MVEDDAMDRVKDYLIIGKRQHVVFIACHQKIVAERVWLMARDWGIPAVRVQQELIVL
jgi:hypothetical protein